MLKTVKEAIVKHGVYRPEEIAEITNLSKVTIDNALNCLERTGYISCLTGGSQGIVQFEVIKPFE
jgi:predicted transcriptional regulator